jgi:2-polyprenyl-3-methyl-5-hydroxy-6-metoxy-1,4-benzoquinol methylase
MTAEEILKCWEASGCRFDPEVVRSLRDEGVVHLYICSDCGFEFFDPRLEGNAKFYEALFKHVENYYVADSAEYLRNTQFALGQGYKTILDVGCGSGSALDIAKEAGLKTYGTEPSSTAAAAAARRGHTVFPAFLEEIDRTWEGMFDLITFNQVLEHVAAPVRLIQQATRLLSPQGSIAINVPSATGVLRLCPWLEHNWPPHHLSRWRVKDFHTLAERAGLRVVQAGGSKLGGRELKAVLLDHRKRCRVLQKPHFGLPPGFIRAVSIVYRITALKYVFSSHSHSVYCFLGRQKGKPLE